MIRSPLQHMDLDKLLGILTIDRLILIGAILLFLSYIAANLYTDIKYRRTSNLKHAVSLVAGLCFFNYMHEGSFIILIVMLISLIFGLILEKMKSSSPGDTKMFVVMSVWIASFAHENLIQQSLIFCIVTYAFQLLFAWVSWIKKKGFNNAIREQKEQVIMLLTPGAPLGKEIIFENWPGAVNMCLGAILTLLAGGILV